jgi:hypothetical protein
MRNPKIENENSISNYLESQHLNTLNNYALADTAALNRFYENNIGTPEIRFYDKNGYLMLYRDEKKCNGQNDSLISFLNPLNVIKVDSTQNIHDYLKNLRTLRGEDVDLKEFIGYDYYLIMYWAKWLGKVNSIKMSDWEANLKNKIRNINVKTIKVTTDYMNFWVLDKHDMIKVYSPRVRTTDRKKERQSVN